VEDQDDVRTPIVQILRAHGYRVLEAANGYQALDEAARHPEVLHLMITDVVMPGMPGPELARRLASVHPGTRVLFTSGYSETRNGLEGSVPYIAKPFTPASLVGKVRGVLAREIQEPDNRSARLEGGQFCPQPAFQPAQISLSYICSGARGRCSVLRIGYAPREKSVSRTANPYGIMDCIRQAASSQLCRR
jgi:DNA-binding response OmpR family regulator